VRLRPLPGLLCSALALALAGGACSDPAGPAWEVVHRDLPGALLSVWGTSASDVWAVGGDPGDGSGPTVLHHDGEVWDAIPVDSPGDLWWVHGFEGGPVYAGGAGGRILRYAGGSFEEMETPGTGTVFGIWGSRPDDLWAVGGNPGGGSGAFAWRYDGGSWAPAAGFPEELAADQAVWKVWGSGPSDVWLVGTGGLLLHHDGADFSEAGSPTSRSLFTVHALGGRAAAVGGFGTGVLLEFENGEWRDASPELIPQLIGVCLTGDGGFAVGIDGQVMVRTRDGWELEPTELDVIDPLHGVWVDPEGGVWAVGGQVLVEPLVRGVMIRRTP
jgi:hypothetical protein